MEPMYQSAYKPVYACLISHVIFLIPRASGWRVTVLRTEVRCLISIVVSCFRAGRDGVESGGKMSDLWFFTFLMLQGGG